MAEETSTNINDLAESLDNGAQEVVRGISLSADGSYVVANSKTIQELMILFQNWLELIETLKKAGQQFKETKMERKAAEAAANKEPLEINAQVYIKSAFDKFGRAFVTGAGCPVCGKKQKYLPPGGYCSMECMLKDVQAKAMSFLMAPNEKYAEYYEIIDEIVALLDLVSLTINAITGIPNIIKELSVLPEEYKQYVMLKINEGFCELQVLIQKLMQKKAELLKKIIEPIKLGWITKPVSYILVGLDAIQQGIDYAKQGIDIGYNAVLKALEPLANVPGGTSIEPTGIAFVCTPRSFISPLGGISPDAGKLFVNLPNANGMAESKVSLLENVNFEPIDTIIQEAFPPLSPVDYYLEPELFKVRYLFSDQGTLVKQVRQQLEDLLTVGPDYLPKFENLLPIKKFTIKNIDIWFPNIGYLWFLLGLADSWAPHSKSLVGSFMNPAV